MAGSGAANLATVVALLLAMVPVLIAWSTRPLNMAQIVAFERYLMVPREPPEPPGSPARRIPGLRHGIEFRDVWFRYHNGQDWILRGVRLFLPAGASVALAGRSASGKSTLIKLLCRRYDPDRGVITWDGIDLRAFDVDALRLCIGRDVMIHDESSSGPASEYEARRAAEELGTGSTRVLGSHRIAALREADVIVVISRGRVVEQGCHDDLIKAGGDYAELFHIQDRGDAAGLAEEYR